MIYILAFFIGHWFLSLFFHSFFLHRFASHQMYTTTKNWEKTFYFLTWFTQGSSFLVPRAYAVLHRMHHTYSDTDKDPHSPHFFKDIYHMMLHTAQIFRQFVKGEKLPDEEFTKEYIPKWEALDNFGHHSLTRLAFGVFYASFYILFAPNYWWFLLLPFHFIMGPMQGAIVNWFGHKFGYSNFNNGDHSKNSEPWGLLLMGELFQNNHHKDKYRANFATRWFEVDFTYVIMKGLHACKIIRLKPLAARVAPVPVVVPVELSRLSSKIPAQANLRY